MKRIEQLCAVCCILFIVSGCTKISGTSRGITKTGIYFDTMIEITIYNGDESVLDNAFALCDRYEALFSRTKPGSEIYQLNHAQGTPLLLNDETVDLINKAVSYSKMTDGAFDITVCPLTELWNFGDGEGTIPSDVDLNNVLKEVGYHNISVSGNQVTLNNGAEIDLGGIAKGYIADRLYDYLKSMGVTGGIINLGGNILCIGSKPDGTNFSVGIKNPQNTATLSATIQVSDTSIVTSGAYERYFVANGVIYHHILDTKTGMPANSDIASATIICKTSADADALSTICFLYGSEKAMRLIESIPACEAVFIKHDGTLLYSSGIGNGGIPIQ